MQWNYMCNCELRDLDGQVEGIVLAAGRSLRMGESKMLLPFDGKRTMVEVVARCVRPLVRRLIVVVGYRGDEVTSTLAGCSVEIVRNPDLDRGMTSSVQCGIAAMNAESAALICLGDQPFLPASVFALVLSAARRSGKGIVIPTFNGRRGHPLYLAPEYRSKVLKLANDQTLHTVTRGYIDDTLEVTVDEDSVLRDIDTPADYHRERRLITEGS
ncbi:uncharacterized protein METZ01_LOCUS457922 [marine metagenome]|uniref:MobA-like NTP transferase domain-containing protein n=1 Tax=marine metagenome TaxID=408172 RepID=A0A383ADA6_9ZZZZ